MASLLDVDDLRRIDNRTDIIILLGSFGKRQQTVQMGNDIGVDLYLRNIFLHTQNQVVEELGFERQDTVFGAQNLLFIFLQFLRDVALGLCQCLLAHPVGRHLVLVRIAHLQIVAKHIVVTYLQRRDARLLSLAFLYFQQVVLTAIGYLAQLVEFGIHAVSDHPTLLHQLWRVALNLFFDAVLQRLAQVELFPYPFQGLVVGIETGRLDGLDGLQGRLQLHYFARRYTSHSHLRYNTFQVADAMNLLIHTLAELRLAVVILHNVQTLIDRLFVLQRKDHPTAQQSAAHWAHRAVYHIEQRLTVFLHRIDQFQRTDGELVQAHVFILLDARDSRDMPYLCVLRLFQILQDGTCSDDAALQMVHAKALQVLYSEVLQELLTGRLIRIHPVIELERKEAVAELLFKVLLLAAFKEYLLGQEIAQQLLHIVGCSLACQELTRRDIKEGHSIGRLAEMHTGQEVVFLVVQHIVRHRHTRGNQLRNAALHQLLRQLGVFQLVTDSHALAGPDQLGQIGVECMMRKSRHLVAHAARTVVTVRQRDAQDARGGDGIFAVGLIEVATPEQHHSVRMFRLQVEKLLHHRGQLPVFLCHLMISFLF